MNPKNFIKDKLYSILIFLSCLGISLLLLSAFKIKRDALIALLVLESLCFIISLTIEYVRKQKFYNNLLENIQKLDKAYYVLETLEKPEFLEGKLLWNALYDINKSMCEEINELKLQTTDFKDYIEMWIHEVKIPIASLILMTHNKKEKFEKNELEQLRRIENYVEQILYYARCENAEKDYLIKKISLSKIISEVALKNKDDLLENKIDFLVEKINIFVYTDSKWLIFIINQIINNSIKYRDQKKKSYIKITAQEEKNKIKLSIKDNGIGIKESDQKKIFEKTFTGENGRTHGSSTGIGLFIAKSLCQKLGHKIEVKSKWQEYTEIIITFEMNSYYDVLNLTKK